MTIYNDYRLQEQINNISISGTTGSGTAELYGTGGITTELIDGVWYIDGSTISGGGPGTDYTFVGAGSVQVTQVDSLVTISGQLSAFARSMVGGRLDIYNITSSGTGTQLYWNSVISSDIGLYNGTIWEYVTPSGSIYLNSNSTTISGATMSGGINYDVFAEYFSSNNFNLVIQEWASSTGRYTSLSTFEGVYVYDLSTQGKKRRYLGTVRRRSTYNLEFVDSPNQRLLMNYYNKLSKNFNVMPLTAFTTQTISVTSWQSWVNDGELFKVEFLSDGINIIKLDGYISGEPGTMCAWGIDSKTVATNDSFAIQDWGAGGQGMITEYRGFPSAGYHYAYPLIKKRSDKGNFTMFWCEPEGSYFRARAQVLGDILC